LQAATYFLFVRADANDDYWPAATPTASLSMPEQRRASFERLEATLLACPKCRRAVQVRKRLLLILPEGDKYEYVCPHCGSTCGSTVQKDTAPRRLM